MALVPFLFLAGLAFGYFVVLRTRDRFLQNFNDDNFDILVQASTYYKFVDPVPGGDRAACSRSRWRSWRSPDWGS